MRDSFHQARYLTSFCLVLLGIFFIRSAFAYINGQRSALAILLLNALLLLLVPFLSKRTGDFKHLSFLTALLVLSGEAAICLLTPRIHSSFIFFVPLAVVFVSFMSGILYGAFICVIGSIEAVFVLKQTLQFVPPGDSQGMSADLSISFFSYLLASELGILCITLFLYFILDRSEAETSRKRILRAKSTRKAAIAEVMGKLAHEVNNPLAIVQGSFLLYKRELMREHPQEPWQEQLLGNMYSAQERIRNVIQSLRTFMEGDQVEPIQDIALADLLLRLKQQSYEQSRSHGVQLSTELPSLQHQVRCRPQQILFVLSVFLENALEAILNEPREVTLRFETDGKVDRFELDDNGIGISDSIADSIFQPFVSTKPINQSMGMNLSVCAGIIAEHRGQIGFERKKRGTLFWFELPGLK